MNPAAEAEDVPEQLADVRRMMVAGFVAWPLFHVLDLLGTNLWNGGRGISTVVVTRVVGMALLVGTYVAARRPLTLASIKALDLTVSTGFGIILGILGVYLGGVPSRAFAGFIVVIAFRAAMYPCPWRRALRASAAMAAGWPLTLLAAAWVRPDIRAQLATSDDRAAFGYGMVYILFSAGLSIVGSHAVWAVRREVRAKSRELAENRAELAGKVAQLETNNVELRRLNEELAVSNRRADRIFSALAEALPGTVLDGKYHLRDRIGAGGFGVVFRATHLALRREIAVKVFRPSPGNDSADALERFRREAISTCLVNHPNAITVYDSGISREEVPYLAMELLEGETLSALLAREGPLELRRCVTLILPVCDALQAAHDQGIVHRDVKPDNVFLHREGGREIVKVVDFGIAALLGTADASTMPHKLTATNVIVGTPAYVAPERILGDPYDGRSDVYSIGVMIYEMLSGHLPVESGVGAVGLAAFIRQATGPARPLREWVPELPQAVDSLVMSAIARQPGARPTAAALASALRDGRPLEPPARGTR